MTKRVQTCLQMQGGHFRTYIYMTFFSLFLGVQSAPEVGPTSYETPYVYI